jgi:tRNA dimethylallyltransferase
MNPTPVITILGPTAIGKTRLACQLTKHLNGELVSADSRQVYKKMDIGTGKDLSDFQVHDFHVPYHLIDIRNAGEMYNVFEFQRDFLKSYEEISKKGKPTILCGGTGMYLSAALQQHQLQEVPENIPLRKSLGSLSADALVLRLQELRKLHNTTDVLDKERLIRAIEIATFESSNPKELMPTFPKVVIGLRADRHIVKANIHQRLKDRLANGMIEEVEDLLDSGVSHQQLMYYGLEYRFISQFLKGVIDKNQLFTELYKAICNYAKRQMTWFRRMEKQGTTIHWITATESLDAQVQRSLTIIEKQLNA